MKTPGFSPGDRDLMFATSGRETDDQREGKVSVPAIGI